VCLYDRRAALFFVGAAGLLDEVIADLPGHACLLAHF
jgi:hypothetical protein